MLTPYPPQQVAIDHLSEVILERGAVLNASDTGTGKTLMSVEVSRKVDMRPLVICPKSVIPDWHNTFEEQGVPYRGIINYDLVRRGNTLCGSWVGEPPMKGEVDEREFVWNEQIDLIIWDEVHKCKESTSLSSRMLKWAAVNEDIYNLLVSATVAKDPTELRTVGYTLGIHRYYDFAAWAKRHGCKKDRWKKWQFTTNAVKAEEILTELNSELYPTCGYKVHRSQLSEFFSNGQIITTPVDFGDDGEIAKIYEEMEIELAELDDKEAEDSVSPEAEILVAMLRARQRVELEKIPLIAEMVNDAIAEGWHVAVFLNFNASIKALNARLGGNCPVVWGTDPDTGVGQSSEEREMAIDAFQSNRDNVILLNVEAGGVAISLHDKIGCAPRQALISPSWNEKTIKQVLGRVDRAGALSDTLQRILFAAGSVEEKVRESLDRKLKNLETLHQSNNNDMPRVKKTPAKKVAPTKKTTKKRGSSKQSKKNDDVIDVQGEEVVEEQPAHARYGPSSLKYFETCPSYTNREEEPEENQHEMTLAGSRIHDALEHENPELLKDDEEQMLAWQMLNKVYANEEMFGVDEGEKFNEIRLQIDLSNEKTFGTMDRFAYLGSVGVAHDYKCGWTPVDDAEINSQAWAYTLGCFQRFPDVDIIYFYFLAPRQNSITMAAFVRDEDVEIPDWWEEEGQEIAGTMHDIHLRLNLVISKAKKLHGKKFNPTPHVCEWCGLKAKCQALNDKALLIYRDKAEDGLLLPDNLDADLMDTPEEIGKARMMVPVLEAWVADVKKKANEMAFEEDCDIPGFKKMTKKTKRVISNPVAAFNVGEGYGLTLAEFIECVGSVRITDLEGKIRDAAPQGSKEDNLEAFLTDLDENDIITGGDHTIKFLQIDRTKNK